MLDFFLGNVVQCNITTLTPYNKKEERRVDLNEYNKYDPRHPMYSKRTAVSYDNPANPYSGMSNDELVPMLEQFEAKEAAQKFIQKNPNASRYLTVREDSYGS